MWGVKHVRSMSAAPPTRGGGYPPPSSTTASCYMCTAITWTSTDTSTSSTTSFIIIKFKNTAFSEIIMNEPKNVDDKRNCIHIYIVALTVVSHSHTHTLPLYLSIIIIMRAPTKIIFYSKRPCPCEVFRKCVVLIDMVRIGLGILCVSIFSVNIYYILYTIINTN